MRLTPLNKVKKDDNKYTNILRAEGFRAQSRSCSLGDPIRGPRSSLGFAGEHNHRMRRSALTSVACAVVSLGLGPFPVANADVSATASTTRQPMLAVLDIELSGDLGGPQLTTEHAQRIKTQSERLRRELAQTGKYQIVDLTPAQHLINQLQSRQAYLHDCNGCDLDIGRAVEAQKVMVTWVNRVSGLILTLTYEIHDVATGQIDMRKSYDFRGDNDNAWAHAITYMVRDLQQS